MELTDALKKRFCKDYNLPIQVYNEPYFSERVELLGKTDKLKMFEELVESFAGNEQEYNAFYNRTKDSIIDFIKGSEAFEALNKDDMNKYAVKSNIRQGDIFKPSFVGKELISIDMSKANFSALVYYGKETNTHFHDNYSWKDFMKMFTDFDYLVESKYIRQVVFGNCNPKRQVTYEKYIMSKVVKHIEENSAFKESELLSYCNDELIFDVAGHTEDEVSKLKSEIELLSESIVPLKIEHFILGKVNGTTAYVKKYINDTKEYEVKCAGPYDTIFALRKLNNENITNRDLVFISEGRHARYLETPKVEVSYEQGNN